MSETPLKGTVILAVAPQLRDVIQRGMHQDFGDQVRYHSGFRFGSAEGLFQEEQTIASLSDGPVVAVVDPDLLGWERRHEAARLATTMRRRMTEIAPQIPFTIVAAGPMITSGETFPWADTTAHSLSPKAWRAPVREGLERTEPRERSTTS